MGTASTMNSLSEALGMCAARFSAAIPAPYRERGQEIAYDDRPAHRRDGRREDLKPSDIMTREAFENVDCRQHGDRRLDQRA